MRTYIADRRVHRIFPRGERKFKKKSFSVREARAIFFAPPWEIFAHPQGGARFSQGGAKRKYP